MPGIDPTPFTAWGVLGLLGVTVAVLLGIIWRLSAQQSASMKENTSTIISFINTHRGETTKALEELGKSWTSSNDKVIAAFTKQARALDQVLITDRILNQLERMKKRGTQLTDDEIDKAVRLTLREHTQTRSSD